ncbi:MAG: ethanolamine ammonia-lyase subunit EutC [Anaeromyxobacter sp.]
MSRLVPDPWTGLRALTGARIALGRAGGSLPTAELLRFSAAHAAARDAVWSALDLERLEAQLAPLGLPLLRLRTQAPDRATYLRRPDLGRRLDPGSATALAAAAPPGGCDVALILADGLSATATQAHGAALAAACVAGLRGAGLCVGPLALVTQARVAVEDSIGAALRARVALILVGERPGSGSPDSLGAYLVHAPRAGRTDAERNCVSNVRPEGLPVPAAAELLCWLVQAALGRGLSGVELKDERGLAAAVTAPALCAG